MARCSKHRGEQIKNHYHDQVDKAISSITKNFNDMDLQNNTVHNSIEEIINKMKKEGETIHDVVNHTKLR